MGDVFKNDTSAPLVTRPFARVSTETSEDKLFVMHTAFYVGWSQAFQFSGITKPVLKALPQAKGLVGYTLANRPSFGGLVSETVTVWNRREDMANFFRGREHQEGMRATKEDLSGSHQFKSQRCWVTAEDLPQDGDYFGTRSFVTKLKRDEFEAAAAPPSSS